MANQFDGDGIEVSCPENVYNNWMHQFHLELEEYSEAKRGYDIEFEFRQPFLNAYHKSLDEYQQNRKKAAQEWARNNQIKIARSNSRKSLKKDWIERLEGLGFCYEEKPPVHPFPEKLICPQPPQEPPKTYWVNFKGYVPGSLPEVEKALDWAGSLMGSSMPKHSSEIDDDFMVCELGDYLREISLEKVRKQVLAVFKEVVEGRLRDPKAIWDKLTDFEIDYSQVIGMKHYSNFMNHESTHRDFGRWHEINFSATGYWLIEFQSLIEPTITFHVPYQRFLDLEPKIELDNLTKIESEQLEYGRVINSKERKKYPLNSLLKIFGKTPEDFPWELEEYSRPSYRHDSENFWEDDEEDEDW